MKNPFAPERFHVTRILCIIIILLSLPTAAEMKNLSRSLRHEMIPVETARTIALENLALWNPQLQSRNLNNNSIHSSQLQLNRIHNDKTRSSVLAYVFTSSPGGYIVIPANPSLPSVLAYSDSSAFSWDESPHNILLHMIRKDIQLRLDALENGIETAGKINSSIRSVKDKSDEKTFFPPLLTFPTWHQESPYNDHCPIDPTDGRRCLAGCLAVVGAQIMNYWQSPRTVEFKESDSYQCIRRDIFVFAPPASFKNLDYHGGYPENQQKAVLCFAFGVLIKMDYRSIGSGSSILSTAEALKTRLGYVESTHASGYDNPEILNDIKKGCPVILGIAIESDNSEHAIIADGYNASDNFFHLNFGWGGTSDGWYQLPAEMPNEYSVVCEHIRNLYPSPVGNFGDATYDPEFIAAYLRNNGMENMGQPVDAGMGPYLRSWGSSGEGIIQDFSGGIYQYASIIKKKSAEKAWVLTRKIRDTYFLLEGDAGVLGWPTSDCSETLSVDTTTPAVSAEFQKGTIVSWSSGNFHLYGPIYQTWHRMGKEKSSLGLPTSSIYTDNGTQKADFQFGSIYLDENGNAVIVNQPQGGNTTNTGGGGGGCFIATAALDSPLHKDVIILSRFRDTVLLPTPWGKGSVKIYYALSPPLAAYIRKNPILKTPIRSFLKIIVLMVRYPLHVFLLVPLLATILASLTIRVGYRKKLRISSCDTI